MNFNFNTIPSVIERHDQPLINAFGTPEKNIQLYEEGSGYLIGDLALSQGQIPYRNINSSPVSIDYQLFAKAGLLLASGGKSGELVVTTGFPYTTYELYKQQAAEFFTPRDIFIEFNADSNLASEHKKIQITIKHFDVIPEILGCITALRKGALDEKQDFFVVSLGYGTCETGMSTSTGLISRTCMSAPGLRHAVNNMHQELARNFNLGMKNEHMINQSFQHGTIVLDRKRKDLTDMRREIITSYYNEVISPTIKKAFNDNDYDKAQKLYLVGGGALYPDMVNCFQREFEGVLDVVVPNDASYMASLGYCLRSYEWCGPANANMAVGLDVGNAYTVVGRYFD